MIVILYNIYIYNVLLNVSICSITVATGSSPALSLIPTWGCSWQLRPGPYFKWPLSTAEQSWAELSESVEVEKPLGSLCIQNVNRWKRICSSTKGVLHLAKKDMSSDVACLIPVIMYMALLQYRDSYFMFFHLCTLIIKTWHCLQIQSGDGLRWLRDD